MYRILLYMKLHRNLVFATIDSLDEIFNHNKQASKVLQGTLKRDKRWGSRDRSFIALTTYDIVRWKRLYEEIADVKAPYKREDLFRMFAVWATLRGVRLPDWRHFEGTPTRRIKGKFDELSQIRKYRESIPDWLDEVGVKELGKNWDKELASLNEQAEVILRVNTLVATLPDVQAALTEEGIETETLKGYPDALKLVERANVFSTESFKKGFFEVQDASSQLVAPYLDVQPGMRVVDACAGAGGKTLHLAAKMENKGQIISMDIYDGKLRELKRRARRGQAHNIETRWIENNKAIKKLHGKADRLLLDAPCTGLGVLRRNPDSKWKLSPEFLDRIRKTQQEILQSYSPIVKSGGKMVYATCSILPSENQEQVKTFLESEAGKNFKLLKQEAVSPSQSGFDGFYIALMEKN